MQRASVVQAYDDFLSLWLELLEHQGFPNPGTFCTLVASHQKLPSKGDVAAAWTVEAEKVLEDPQGRWLLSAPEFTETVHRLRCCG